MQKYVIHFGKYGKISWYERVQCKLRIWWWLMLPLLWFGSGFFFAIYSYRSYYQFSIWNIVCNYSHVLSHQMLSMQWKLWKRMEKLLNVNQFQVFFLAVYRTKIQNCNIRLTQVCHKWNSKFGSIGIYKSVVIQIYLVFYILLKITYHLKFWFQFWFKLQKSRLLKGFKS